ncbi:MAG: BamA/TamA family outer membrane protein [Chitinophagales bacterium]
MQRTAYSPLIILSVLGLLLFSLDSCKVAKSLPPDQNLLVKNKIVIKNKLTLHEKDKLKADLGNVAVQKPNHRFLGFLPFRMWLYYSASKGKKITKFKQWIMDKVGERPVIVDSASTERSEVLMENYLFNYGYFYADVSDSTVIKNKKAVTTYTITPGPLWHLGKITFPQGNTAADSLIRQSNKNTLLKTGDRVDMAVLRSERVRIEDTLRNNGYYFFNREYITYELDTSGGNQTMNAKMVLNQPSDSVQHQPYRIGNIYVVEDYIAETLGDTLHRDTVLKGDYYFIYDKRIVREKVLMEGLYFTYDKLYTKDAEIKTLNRLSQFGTFKYISIDFDKARNNPGYLDGTIRLSPAKRQGFTGTGEVNVTNEGLFGMAASLNYKNKNLSKRADQLLIDASAGLQLKFSKKEKVKIVTTNATFGITYFLNRFVPFKPRVFQNITSPKTKIAATYGFENRYDFDTAGNVVFLYQLHNFNLTFGYDWSSAVRFRHLFNPLAITFYLLPKRGEEFKRRLDSIPILKSSFEEQIIIGPNYTMIFTNQRTDKDRTYMSFRTNVEVAGNVPYLIARASNAGSENDSIYYLFKRPFSQYFRIEADWRNYFRIRNHATFAIRTFAGIGVPYGNSYAMPFIKQFFVGGPNSLRGFLIREVGPGGYVDTTVYDPEKGERNNVGFFNQTGDIKLELNAEFRFDIYKWLKGAVFMDAGNVWTLRKDTRALGSFDINRFWKEFAVDAGVGLRLDFNFFVIRFDYGFPLRDPRKVDGDRWQFENAQFRKGQFQLGVGYPF